MIPAKNLSNSKRKENRSSQSCKQWQRQILVHLMQFCDYTTFAGFQLISKKNIGCKSITVLFVIWAVLVVLVCDLCNKQLKQYYNYDVKTSIRYDTVSHHQFPAITFCNANWYKKSMVGIDDDFIALLSLFSKSASYSFDVALQNRKTCKFKYDNQSVDVEKIKQELLSYMQSFDFESVVKCITITSTLSVLKCWWNHAETDCNKHFVNHALDDKMCFVFNQDRNFIDTISGLLPVFGPKEFATENLLVHSTDPSNGLNLLLNVNQQEYCGIQGERSGAGFSLIVHDAKSETSFRVQSSISLSPGYEYDITLQPIQYDLRNFSESLGKCTSSKYNYLKSNSPYNQQACYQACVIEEIAKVCKCLLLLPGSITKSAVNYLSISKQCNVMTDMQCVLNIHSQFILTDVDVLCPLCKRKCLETKYDYKITSKKLSLPRVQQLITQTVPTNESIEKNFMLVSFHMESMNLITIKETQAITPLAIFMYFSNILCLFLGFTIITIPELVYYIFTSILISLKMCQRNKIFKISNRKVIKVDRRNAPAIKSKVIAKKLSIVKHQKLQSLVKIGTDPNNLNYPSRLGSSGLENIVPGQMN